MFLPLLFLIIFLQEGFPQQVGPCRDIASPCSGPGGMISSIPGGCNSPLNQNNCQQSCQLCPQQYGPNACPRGVSSVCTSAPNCNSTLIQSACPRECKLCTPPSSPPAACINCGGRQQCCSLAEGAEPCTPPTKCVPFCFFGVFGQRCG